MWKRCQPEAGRRPWDHLRAIVQRARTVTTTGRTAKVSGAAPTVAPRCSETPGIPSQMPGVSSCADGTYLAASSTTGVDEKRRPAWANMTSRAERATAKGTRIKSRVRDAAERGEDDHESRL